ncbi:MAG: hypothetical protein CVV64_13570 [Candidatus Wallbacteria bacterium HGW-Wallbacteria-1]|uniref:FecR protein domain-containing protein n=1 Tax=Candidatus Wallbacteria bacterium HGW-Wallbacteria-1 TaxID=2013854 RepID=A0A2N1PMS9_9BACT|nr:MAG: hypothetical protein CVV64_13570 [Candidatus Wallbacteria bacterium HGW-Wallbacteria-1]
MTPAVSIPAKGPSTDTVEMTTPEINWECSADDITGSPMIAVTGKGYKRIVPGDRLIVGSNIRTDSTSSVKLRYRDNTQVNVKPGSEVVVKVNALMLRQGATWLQVTKKGSRFEVTTPTAIAGVLGTRFGVFHSPDGKACISVFEGKVSVTGTRDMLGQAIPASRGQRVLLEAGRKVIFTPSTGMSDIFNTSDSEESIWKSGSRALPSALVEVPAVESDAMDTIPAVNSNAPAVSVDTGSTSSTLPEDLEGEVHYNSMQGLDNNVE